VFQCLESSPYLIEKYNTGRFNLQTMEMHRNVRSQLSHATLLRDKKVCMCGVGRGVGESTRRSGSRLLWGHHIWTKWLSKQSKMKLKYAFHFLITQTVFKEHVHPQYELLSNSVLGNCNMIIFSVLIISSTDATRQATHCFFFSAYFSYFEMSNNSGTHTDGKDSWSKPLKWAQVPWYTHQVS
jgi:hypothetical protein